ncbi:MAG: D-sedoheptulose 7-phosphate isomerase [Candidatus Rokubacteria bacterium]|nr:D-sedoheptulose 7-phosphate isomerase [Candidatus Rokubacteria bacterium]
MVASVREALDVTGKLLTDGADAIERSGRLLVDALRARHKILLFGNGGSAAQAQHLAAELVARYLKERPALAAIALTTDTSTLTAIGNDYGFERLFARQVEALAEPGDVAIAISTSGTSANVLAGVVAARERGCRVIGLTGAGGAELATRCDVCVVVPSATTARTQEAHLLIGHVWCEIIDNCLVGARRD